MPSRTEEQTLSSYWKTAQKGLDMKDIFDDPVLKLFRELSQIPRESENEEAASNWIKSWAEERGYEADQDEIFDLIVKKPASPGYEDHPAVMIQAHMDMVCEKNADSNHNFETDPIELVVDGEWLTANGTTLGADDGIGVATLMAILDDKTLQHPPIEAIFTSQEETTFAGAETVDLGKCSGTRLINLDHANEKEYIVGSCGGIGAEFTMELAREEKIPADLKAYHIRLTGMMGGHSGEDIHRGRGNAISLLFRLLESPGLALVCASGGTNRLAIPREAEAVVMAESDETIEKIVGEAKATFRKEYSTTAPDLDILIEPAEAPLAPLTAQALACLTAVVRLYPNGIVQMNGDFKDTVVESSDNVGIISVDEKGLSLISETRAAYTSTVEDIQKSIDALAAFAGAKVEYFTYYAPWEFTTNSKLGPLAVQTYTELYGEGAKMVALHAGLECGFFAERKPGLDMVSIGPDCESFHSPDERVRIPSVAHTYEVLKALLAKL